MLAASAAEKVLTQAAQTAEQVTPIFGCRWEQHECKLGLKYRAEVFYSSSTALFSPSALDQTLWAQGIWDLNVDGTFFQQTLISRLNLRNKYRWGSLESIAATSTTPVKLGDTTVGDHLHYIGKQLFWLREGWLELDLKRVCSVETAGTQHFKLGIFPFELGRGIALGSAYAGSPGLLGFYADSTVDQNTPGFLLSGELLPTKLTYDLYLGLLRNWTDSFGRVNEKVYLNQLQTSDRGARGFGHVNFVIANRLRWLPWSVTAAEQVQQLVLEPYWLYNRDPEQPAIGQLDATSNLFTIGLATEYAGPKFELGCEWALNFGHQSVKSWDHNQINIVTDANGILSEQYTKIFTNDPSSTAIPTAATVTGANQAVVDRSSRSPAQNGQEIGSSGLYNALDRFSAPYRNHYHGAMCVVDGSWIISSRLRLSGTIAWASGDEHPNHNPAHQGVNYSDNHYQGFIGLQEYYSGKRVISLFVLGDNGIARPLSAAHNSDIGEFLPANTAGFSNLVYSGLALTGHQPIGYRSIDWNLGLLSYWQDFATKRYNLTLRRAEEQVAAKHLGVEYNLTVTANWLKEFKTFLVTGVFVPGQHYHDIRGEPLTSDDIATLEELNADQYTIGKTPLLWTNTAWVLNFGCEYAF